MFVRLFIYRLRVLLRNRSLLFLSGRFRLIVQSSLWQFGRHNGIRNIEGWDRLYR